MGDSIYLQHVTRVTKGFLLKLATRGGRFLSGFPEVGGCPPLEIHKLVYSRDNQIRCIGLDTRGAFHGPHITQILSSPETLKGQNNFRKNRIMAQCRQL